MNASDTITWLLPYLVYPMFYAGISILMYYIQYKNTRHKNGVSNKQQQWIDANQTALNYLLYTSIGFLLGLIVFLLALGKAEVERSYGSSINLFSIFSCTILMVLSNVVRNYKLKQIANSIKSSSN